MHHETSALVSDDVDEAVGPIDQQHQALARAAVDTAQPWGARQTYRHPDMTADAGQPGTPRLSALSERSVCRAEAGLESLLDAVDREGNPMHSNLVGHRGLRLHRRWVDVLEELETTVPVWRPEHRNVGVIAIKADGSVGPFTTDRVTPDDRETEVGET